MYLFVPKTQQAAQGWRNFLTKSFFVAHLVKTEEVSDDAGPGIQIKGRRRRKYEGKRR
jgi:hypothetical protein